MAEGGFFEKRPISPMRLTLVVGVHAAAIAALALSKFEGVPDIPYTPIELIDVKEKQPPEPVPPEPVEKQQPTPIPPRTQIDVVPPVVPTVTQRPAVTYDPTITPPPIDLRPPPPINLPRADPLPPPPPVRKDPVRVEATMRSSNLQPPYPASEEAKGMEGRVTVRVTIGADGRVKAIEKMSATTDGFWRATERHALRAWRFTPAKVDGQPVESTKVLTVHFRLND